MNTLHTEEKQRYRLGDFEGPLDLLLFLIKKSEINIYDIPISQITEQYLSYLAYATKIDLENLTDFYVMAASLLYIKSKMLLPEELEFDDEYEDPRRDLVERLIEYQKIKEYSKLMAEREKETEWRIERSKKQRVLPFPDADDLWERLEIWDILKTFSTLISSLSSERIIDLYEEVTINEKITLINEMLSRKGEFLFTDLIVKTHSIMEIICAFFAVLESVKSKRVSIFQNKMFGDIRITNYTP